MNTATVSKIETTAGRPMAMLHAGIESTRKLLLVDDHELVRYGVKSLYTELQGVALEWENQRVGRW